MTKTATLLRNAPDLGATAAAGQYAELDALGSLDFRSVVEQADVGVCITQDSLFRYVNPRYAEMHGYRSDELIGVSMFSTVHPAERERVAKIRRLRDLGRHAVAYETCSRHRDGTPISVRVFGRTISYRGETAQLVTISDISDLTRAHQLAAWQARMLVSHEQLSGSGSIEIDLARRSVLLSEGAQALVDPADNAERMTLRAALRSVPPADRRRLVARWRRARPGSAFRLPHDMIRSDGSVRRVLHRGVIEVGAAGAPDRPVAVLLDITEQAESQARIDRLVNCHPVTGLATRALLLDRSEAAIRAAGRADRSVAMLYLRVPQLERVHDALGLQAGDMLAVAIADRLVRSCRAGDTIAHLGNGEFAVLFGPTASISQASVLGIGQQLLAALEQPTTVRSTEVIGAGQVGIAMYPGDASTAADLLEHARAACGLQGVGLFTPEVGERAARRIRLEAGLRHALDRRELTLEYQPQVDLRSGAVVGLEALLRWTSDEFGRVSPAEFVPIAEEIGLIVAIGEWVFRSACEQSFAWARAGLPGVRIGVNLSPRQLEQPNISQRLQAIILETGADPGRLGIEVTESMLMRDIDSARRTLVEFAAIGIEIALDDFGTGYSNISLLRALPFHVLKIDRSLVHDVTAAPEDVSITRGVLLLAQALKIRVLAEGVETEGQLKLLIAHGCELMQGFIFSRPLPVAAVEALLRAGSGLPGALLGSSKGSRRTLLLVRAGDEDDAALRRLLRDEACQIVVARSGEEGLARLAEHAVDVIVAEQRLPGMTGIEFLRRAKDLRPETVRIVLSAEAGLQTLSDAINEGTIFRFLDKPWSDDRLHAHVSEAFRHKAFGDDHRRLAEEVRRSNLELANANQRQERLLARQREQLSLETYRALSGQDLLEYLPTALIGIDADGEVAFANRAARSLIGEARPLVACPAERVLPADWLAARRAPEGGYREIAWAGGRHLLSCTEMTEPDSDLRGHLLSIIPLPAEDALP